MLESGFCPARFVGAAIHWALERRAASVQSEVLHPRAAIHRAPGATPMEFPPPSPTMVPMVWVPWPLSSAGALG
ncbi:MAG: hypothetical protein BWY88_00486 [Synergistetes bacterium ADurb.Bin520]|nr:MAG: hypothetical protein BWY88_00486 [Synergistetes bacterium ADurb.Bin520]